MKYAAVVVMTLLAVLTGCSGGTSNTVAVSLSPASVTVQPGKSHQFTATVTGTSNTAVTWEVNGTAGGDSTHGTISATGLYTAPANPTTATITAVAQADTTQSASATVTVALAISITPTSAAITVSQAQQFTATVTFSTNTAVNWQVNGIAGGNATYGTISTSGLYTAPATVTGTMAVTITAVAQADTTQSASASLRISPPQIVISPTGVVLSAGAQQQFTANASSQTVTPSWSVQCDSGSPRGCGTITSDGLYTAPGSPPEGGNVVITANMLDGSAVKSNTTVSVQFSDATLAGPVVFAFTSGMGPALSVQAGMITFDGAGNVTGGMFDDSSQSGTPIAITGGTYNVGADGRGTSTIQTASGTASWQFVITNDLRGFVTGTDANGATVSGTLDLQQPGKFGIFQGSYALSVAGAATGSSSAPFAMAGSLTADGAGNLTRGILDINDAAAVTASLSATGAYTAPSSSGRGTLTLSSTAGTQSFVYYQIDDTHLKLVEIDGVRTASGDLYKQPAGPFTNSSFHGPFALTLTGTSGGAPLGMGGVFTLNGSAGVTNRLLDGVNQTVFDSQGGYVVTDSASGRTSMTWTANNGSLLQYVLYPRADGGFVMLETDGSSVAAGSAFPQALSYVGAATPVGNFALGLTGTELAAGSQVAISGQLVLTGGASFSGTLDSAASSALVNGIAFQAEWTTVDATTGRGLAAVPADSAVLSGGTLIFYILDSDRALSLESDSTRIYAGILVRQY